MTAAYQLTAPNMNGNIIRTSDGAVIPPNLKNVDYEAYQLWLTQGNTPDPYVAPTLTVAQQAANALSAGLIITSTSTPAISGTYPLDTLTQAKIDAIITFILANGTFPEGSATFEWPDTVGALHVFPSIAEFKLWATAIANYVNLLDLYGLGIGTTLPAATVTIA